MKKRVKSLYLILMGILSFFVNTSMNRTLQKEYRLIYFKYAPEDILIKVYPLNPTNTEEANTDYIISKLDNSSINLFLVKKSPNERDYVNYKYRVVFYKPQNFKGDSVNVPIYSFQIYFDGEDAVIKYEPFKAIPKEIKESNLEKKFAKHPATNIYFIKDYNDEDFLLNERMRKVKFIGKIKNANGTYSLVKPEANLKIKLIKMDEEGETDNSSDIKKDYIVEVPLYQDVTLGLVAYKIQRFSEYSRYDIKSIIVNNVPSDTKIIHFAEIWNNMYEQELIFEDDGTVIDFRFDPELYDLEYIIDNNLIKQKESPLSLSLKQYDDKNIKINLTAKDFVVKYLRHPTETIEYKSVSYKRGIDVIKEINEKYPDFTEITEDGSLNIKPNFNQVSFVIFTNPTRAKIKYKRLEPQSKNSNYETVELGESPVFFEKFDFGKYLISASWYEKDDKGKVKEYFKEKIVEFSDPPSKKYLKDISYLKKGETEIPYLMFYLTDGEKKEIAVDNIEDKKNITTDLTADIFEKEEATKDLTSDQTTDLKSDDLTTDIVETTTTTTTTILQESTTTTTTTIQPITTTSTTIPKATTTTTIPKKVTTTTTTIKKTTTTIKPKTTTTTIKEVTLIKKAKEDLKYIKKIKSKTDIFYIQLAAFKAGEKPLSFINYYAEIIANEYKKMYNRDIKGSLFLANKIVNKKKYIVIVFGSFNKLDHARKGIALIYKVVNDAFIVNQKVLLEETK